MGQKMKVKEKEKLCENDELAVLFPTGTVAVAKQLINVDWFDLRKGLKSKEFLDDFESFRYSANNACSSAILSVLAENEVNVEGFTYVELELLQSFRFDAYLDSCDSLRHDSNIDDVVGGDVLDLYNFYGLSEAKIRRQLSGKLRQLKFSDVNQEFYAYRKGLAKLDFIKLDGNFDEILEKLTSESRWSEQPACNLPTGLWRHFSLLQELKNDESVVTDSIGALSGGLSSTNLLDAVSRDCFQHLVKYRKDSLEGRMVQSFHHLQLKSLMTKRSEQVQELGTIYVPPVPDPILQLYYEQNPPKFSFKEVMLLKCTEGKNLIKRARPALLAMGFMASLGVGFTSMKLVDKGKLSSI